MTTLEKAQDLIRRHDEWTFASEELARPGVRDGTLEYAREVVRLNEVTAALLSELALHASPWY